ncbi:hypothetical protein B4135_1505 [Caldibacillus debilis]|uniref:Uncharacterized protein n=1 Tax=Caldibacillus debilis TaxID=301148 RepID=A0A150MCC1_9BACI|nr:hypothetical protein B4135_1505 [Caldibacillus debilis]
MGNKGLINPAPWFKAPFLSRRSREPNGSAAAEKGMGVRAIGLTEFFPAAG